MTDTDLIARMEAGLAEAQREIEEAEAQARAARERHSRIEVAIRTAREFLIESAPAPVGSSNETNASTTGTDAEESATATTPVPQRDSEVPSRWTGVSIREAGIRMLGRQPGVVVWTEDMARALVSEGYPYQHDIRRFRETLATVLKQHISSGLEPRIEKAGPARFVMPRGDAFGQQTSLMGENETAAHGEPQTTESVA
jgi:hypothetical protein